MTIYEATITKLQKLPESLVQEVNQFIESLAKRQSQTEQTPIFAYDLSKQWLGCAELPPDLSQNKKYMEGYGK
ncbi:DUF2281 domain-containing protein [Pseudanabaena sp. 'Roaring Creek']|uniref:DUF2281 domain-containing protein n=1 Tax=Pseudanabaena sp. 'Roaring Creek' TaxID=1681830 RepID=UPI0006D7CD0E|nr:DUF2281 domain-containing protein [Pseudanabaena sp. 'Roaring Creek']